jgi:8-oxo-dGTP pyrophosphatase MutT (NUDIX family)
MSMRVRRLKRPARRELLEETGMTAKTLELLGVLAPDSGRLVNRIWCFFAGDVTPAEHDVQREDGITVLDVERRRSRWRWTGESADLRDPSGD